MADPLFGSPGANELDFVELGIGYAMQLKGGVKPQDAIGTQLTRRCEAVDHHPLRRQMGGHRGKHLATDALDVAGPQMMPEQARNIGPTRRVAEGRRELSPGKYRMSRQETGRFVLARLH
jgi:hypothetical protein